MKTATRTCSGFFALILMVFSTLCAHAQMTIGSNRPPAPGALLDLKEKDETQKGLGLPRVKLISLHIPDGKSLAQTIEGTANTDNWSAEEHIGLVIYNVNVVHGECLNGVYQEGFGRGVYVWEGTRWMRLPVIGDVRTVTDHGTSAVNGRVVGSFTMAYKDGVNPAENETYFYADFGNAGIWMTQNLRTHYTPGGLRIAATATTTSTGLDADGEPVYNLAYPHSDTGYATDPAGVYNDHKEYGVLYDWYTATGHHNCSVSDESHEQQEEDQKKVIRGICPEGWHLPSDREWNMLEKYLTENAQNLTQPTVTPNSTWDTSWETTIDWRGNTQGTVMKSKTAVVRSGQTLKNANSKTGNEGGFDVYLTGNSVDGYGNNGFIWSASSFDDGSAWCRFVDYDKTQVNRSVASRSSFYSIRCKKD